MNRPILWMVSSLLLTAMLLGILLFKHGGRDRTTEEKVFLYCAAGIKKPLEALAREYEKEYGTRVEIQFGGSGTLLANIELAKTGDLYLAADESYVRIAKEKGLVDESIPVAHLVPVIAFPKGNPKGISKIEDLLRDDVKLALANPDAAAVGRIMKLVLSESGLWDKLEKKVKVFKPTVNELATDVSIGAADAAVVWDAIANQYDELDHIMVPEFASARQRITVGVLKSSAAPVEALRFARFLSSRDRGKPVFDQSGFEGIEGDAWDEEPKILFFSGAMLRAGVEETINEFEKREGVIIDRVYNGCGILVAQMKAGARPEAYLSCDVKFMDMVEERFGPSQVLTENDIVLAVAEGNPHDVKGLADLARKELRVGIGHPENSALGYLSMLLMKKAGLFDMIRKQASVESATADFLVTQILSEGLDLVMVYRSNVMSNPENLNKLDIIDLEMPGAVAAQPWAVAKESDHPFLLARLYEAISSKTSRERFESIGFRWKLENESNGNPEGE